MPHDEPVSFNGTFKEEVRFDAIDGFFLTDFNKEKLFTFKENEELLTEKGRGTLPVYIGHSDYSVNAKSFLSDFEVNGVDKAIFSRIKRYSHKLNKDDLFNKLCEMYPSAFVYQVSSELFGSWIGATPEVLLNRVGDRCNTMSLAGTKPISDNTEWASKEIQEQKYVTDFIERILNDSDAKNIRKGNVETISAGPVKHLRTEFEFNLGVSDVLTVATELHPTPAVSGLPREAALKLIKKHETHDRGFYAGMIGFHDQEKTNLFVNLRCAQVFDNQIALYLGGGYTKDSIVEKEWEETESKALTLLDAISQLKN